MYIVDIALNVCVIFWKSQIQRLCQCTATCWAHGLLCLCPHVISMALHCSTWLTLAPALNLTLQFTKPGAVQWVPNVALNICMILVIVISCSASVQCALTKFLHCTRCYWCAKVLCLKRSVASKIWFSCNFQIGFVSIGCSPQSRDCTSRQQ